MSDGAGCLNCCEVSTLSAPSANHQSPPPLQSSPHMLSGFIEDSYVLYLEGFFLFCFFCSPYVTVLTSLVTDIVYRYICFVNMYIHMHMYIYSLCVLSGRLAYRIYED